MSPESTAFEEKCRQLKAAAFEKKCQRLEQACWDYICQRMLHPEDCSLVYVGGSAWPTAIVAKGCPAQLLDLN